MWFNQSQLLKESDDYGGYRATILCQLENIKQVIHLDIATGDVVTPQPITYDYKAIFDENNFPIIAYTIETILAEKLQTIYSRNFLNSRSKDFYDVYILSKLKKEDIDFIQLRNACQRTFSYRETELDFCKDYWTTREIQIWSYSESTMAKLFKNIVIQKEFHLQMCLMRWLVLLQLLFLLTLIKTLNCPTR